VEAHGITVDVCKNGCSGIWFDDREMKKFDEDSEDASAIVFGDGPQPTSTVRDSGPPLSCPRCKGDAILARRSSGPDGTITIDQCLSCSGIWFDGGELSKYRGQFKTEVERQAAADAFLRPHLASMLDEVHEEIDRTKALTEQYKRADTWGKRFSLYIRDILSRHY